MRYLVLFFAALTCVATEANAAPFTIAGAPAGSTPPRYWPKEKFQEKSPVSEHAPVALEADEVDYDQENDIVTASGNVAVTQGDTVLLADQVTYYQTRNLVAASGHVSMLEPSGNVHFADEVELADDLKSGAIEQLKSRLIDNSLFVAAHANKIDENKMELFKALYTPCKCEENGKPHTPQWQLRADHVSIDQAAQEVSYGDTYFDVYGLPVFYTPYLAHATPGADNESGLLTPEYRHSDNLGSVYKVPVYYAIAPDRDATITPIYTGNDGLVMAGQYRQKFDMGEMDLDGSITRPQNRDALGNPTSGSEIRGHFNGSGAFKISKDYDWGFNIHRTTDDTYLRRYGFSDDTLLISKVYGEGFNFVDGSDRTYASLQGVSFQGLTAQDDGKHTPLVLPLADFAYESNPGAYGSRFSLTGNLLAFTRQEGDESRRMSANAGWKLPYITDGGQVIEFEADLRQDIYQVNSVAQPDGTLFNGTTGRTIPQAMVTWRYPLINRWGDSSLLIEPIANFTVSPNGENSPKIPNEDSQVPEFTDSNLFDANRYAGLDRVETGGRASYGFRGQAQLYSDKYIDWLIGQHYRMNNDPSFPFSNDLTSHFSDYVGKVGVNYAPFSVAYRFRLDKDSLASDRSEVDASYTLKPVTLSGSYLSLKNDPILATKQTVLGQASVNLTDTWTWTVYGQEDLLLNQIISTGTGFVYKNECTAISTTLGRQYTHDRDIKPSTNFLFRVALKNLE